MITRLIPILLLLLAITWPASADAHDFDPERQLLVQVFSDHVDIMIMYTEAPGVRSDLFSAKFGVGAPAGNAEAKEFFDNLAGRAFLPRMLDGLEFEVEGEAPRTGEPELRLDEQEGRLMAAAFVRYELDGLDDDERRTFVVRTQDRSFIPTRTVVYAGDELQLIDHDSGQPRLAPDDFQLTRNAEHRFSFTR